MEGYVPWIIYTPRWTKVKKANHLAAEKVVDAIFTLGVNLCFSYYIIERDLKSFRLATVDDEDDISPPPMVLTPSIMVPLGS